MLHTNNPIIKHKVGLLNLAEELSNASKACKIMDVSRETFYRYQELAENGGVDALINRSKRVPNLKNRVDEAIEQAVISYAIEYQAYCQHRTSNKLRKQGIFVSGSSVRSIWLRHSLENFKKYLKALENKVANEGIILNDQQIAALEKKKHDDEASGEIETAHPGYLGCQDTLLKGMPMLRAKIVFILFICFSTLVLAEECKPIYGEKRSFSSPIIQEIYDRTVSVNLAQTANIDVTDIVRKYIPVQIHQTEKEALLEKQGFKLDKYNAVYVFKKCAWRDKNSYRSQAINISRSHHDA